MSIWNDLVSVDWVGVGTKLVHLIQLKGEVAIDAVKEAVVALEALTARDFVKVWDALNKEVVDLKELEQAVKDTFNGN